jgi:hypothetical protein
MQVEGHGKGPVDPLEEGDELLGAASRPALANDLAGGDVLVWEALRLSPPQAQ